MGREPLGREEGPRLARDVNLVKLLFWIKIMNTVSDIWKFEKAKI